MALSLQAGCEDRRALSWRPALSHRQQVSPQSRRSREIILDRARTLHTWFDAEAAITPLSQDLTRIVVPVKRQRL
jgi:hypothetical protein